MTADPAAAAGRWCTHCGEDRQVGPHAACARRAELEPPRWCQWCRRRMTVQVVPRGWWARCVEHGVTSSAEAH